MGNEKLVFSMINKETYPFFEDLLPELYQRRFKNTPSIQGLGAGLEGQAVGIILCEPDQELPFLRILYCAVAEDFRRQGIGTEMLLYLTHKAYEKGLYATASFLVYSEEEPVLSLFDSSGEFSVERSEGAVYAADRSKLQVIVDHLTAMEKGRVANGISLSGSMKAEKNALIEVIRQTGHDPQELLSRADPELSLVLPDKGGKIRAVILVESLVDEDGFLISYVWASRDAVAIMELFAAVLSSLILHMEAEAVVKMAAVNYSGILEKITKKLSIDLEPVAFLYEAGYNADDPM